MKFLPLFLTFAIFAAAALAADGPIRHVVMFKFKKDASPGKVQKAEEDFAALKKKIDIIDSLEWGTNVSPEKHDKGFTHVWILTFKNEKDRDAYLVHPDHKAFAASLKDVLEDVIVLDFAPKKER
jgi:Stress responsive A/B Barrel Domain